MAIVVDIHLSPAFHWYSTLIFRPSVVEALRGDADKSLARPGRKQVTATQLVIYSTCSSRSSIYFLARCSNFCKPLKKFRSLSVQPGLRGSNDFRFGRKMANSQLYFSVQGTGGSPTGPDADNRVGDQDTGSPGRPVSSGLQVPGEPGHCRAKQGPLGDLPAAFFIQNVPHLHHKKWVILRVDSLALWKIINEEDAVLIFPKNRGENFSSGFLHSEFFWGGWAAMPPLHWLFLCLRVIVI